MIPSYALHNFDIKDDDDIQMILQKRYLLDRHRVWIETYSEQQKKDFDDKYSKIIKMKSKTPIEKLRLEVAVSELLEK